MFKKVLFILCIAICLIGCSKTSSINKSTKEVTKEINNQNKSGKILTPEKWIPNHGVTNISFKKINDDGAREEYVFISQHEGWKAYTEPLGVLQIYIKLYKTVDGGEHWDKIADYNDKTSGISGGNIVFINNNVGWITRYFLESGVLKILKTNDGGIKWEPQELKVPTKYSKVNFIPYIPLFMSKKDGIIFASCDIENSIRSFAFITHDGGETWSFHSEDDDDSFTWGSSIKNNMLSNFFVIYDNEAWHSNDGIIWKQ